MSETKTAAEIESTRERRACAYSQGSWQGAHFPRAFAAAFQAARPTSDDDDDDDDDDHDDGHCLGLGCLSPGTLQSTFSHRKLKSLHRHRILQLAHESLSACLSGLLHVPDPGGKDISCC